jgi:hypothetical protein
MHVLSLLLAPVRLGPRLAAALDDLAVLADRARRETEGPDPLEHALDRLDRVIARLDAVHATSGEIVDGGRELADATERLTAEVQGLRGQLPPLREELGTVAETVEPLQGAAEGVGRLTDRLRRG